MLHFPGLPCRGVWVCGSDLLIGRRTDLQVCRIPTSTPVEGFAPAFVARAAGHLTRKAAARSVEYQRHTTERGVVCTTPPRERNDTCHRWRSANASEPMSLKVTASR